VSVNTAMALPSPSEMLSAKSAPRAAIQDNASLNWSATAWAVMGLAHREWIRFLRQRSRVIGSLLQPVLFWVLFGAGLHGSFRATSGESFQEYFFAGVAVMIVLFTAIFATVSVIEDRREGFLQGVLVSPLPRLAIVLGKVIGGTGLAMFQASVFLLLGPMLSVFGMAPSTPMGLTVMNALPVLGWLFLVGVALTALGYCLAWPMESTQGFHALMSLVLLPMWLLSGSFFPMDQSSWLSTVIAANPLTYGVAGLRRLLSHDPLQVSSLPSLPWCAVVMTVFAGVCLAGACVLTNRPTRHNAR
jgi:ABC-2 type transport system permease protein